MTPTLLVLVLLVSACAAVAGASGLLRLGRGRAVAVSVAVLVVYAVLLVVRPGGYWVSNAAVVVAGAAAGHLLGLVLGSAGSVVAFLVAAATVDLFSFSDGLTGQIIDAYRAGGSTLLRYLAVFVRLGGREYAVVGIGDLLLLTAAYLGFRRATGSVLAPAAWLVAGLLGAFVVGIALGGAPGLPFMAVAGVAFAVLDGRISKRKGDNE